MRQEGTDELPGDDWDTSRCRHISEVLARICDKWTLLVVRTLGRRPRRFNALKRDIGGISQKVLSSTLRGLEENGFVVRTVTPSTPPQVEYALTDLGTDFLGPVRAIAGWVMDHADRIDDAQAAFLLRKENG
jgi:DNA-binding HxlR family transcriptional regulator